MLELVPLWTQPGGRVTFLELGVVEHESWVNSKNNNNNNNNKYLIYTAKNRSPELKYKDIKFKINNILNY